MLVLAKALLSCTAVDAGMNTACFDLSFSEHTQTHALRINLLTPLNMKWVTGLPSEMFMLA
jgi:hypothetical protein